MSGPVPTPEGDLREQVQLLRDAAAHAPMVIRGTAGIAAGEWLLAEAACHESVPEVAAAAVDLVDSIGKPDRPSEIRVAVSTLGAAVEFARSVLALPQPEGDLRAQIAEALNSCHDPLTPELEHLREGRRHDGHQFHHACALCRGDVGLLSDHVLSEVVEPELARLREENAALKACEDAYWATQKVLDSAIGMDEWNGAGQGLAGDVAFVVRQRDEARAAVSRLSGGNTTPAGAGRVRFAVGDLVRWCGDTGYFEGRISAATSDDDRMHREKWDVTVTNLGTFYADEPARLGAVVHVEEERIMFLAAGSAVATPDDTPDGELSLLDRIKEARLREAGPFPSPSEDMLRYIASAGLDIPVDALFAVAGGTPQAGEIWRVGRDQALLVWVRKVFDDGAVDCVPVVLDTELADDETLLIPADSTPVGFELAAMTALRIHLPVEVFLNIVCFPDIAAEITEVMDAAKACRPPVGVRVGPPIMDDADRRIEYRCAVRDVLAGLLPSASPVGDTGDTALPEEERADPDSPAVNAALFAVALDRVRRDKGTRHTLDDVVREMDAIRDAEDEQHHATFQPKLAAQPEETRTDA